MISSNLRDKGKKGGTQSNPRDVGELAKDIEKLVEKLLGPV